RRIASRMRRHVEPVQASVVVICLELRHLVVTSSQISVERRPEPIGVADPGRFAGRNGDELEHPAVAIRPDGQQPVLAVVVVLHEPDGAVPCVLDVGIVDAMLQRRRRHLHMSILY
ncbi:MAG: hypothetical protein ACRCSN_08975, partial [Dermatophilaceae bacterium]